MIWGRRRKVAQPLSVWERDHVHKSYNILEFRLLTKYFFTIYCFIDFNARKTLLWSERLHKNNQSPIQSK